MRHCSKLDGLRTICYSSDCLLHWVNEMGKRLGHHESGVLAES